MPNLRLSRRTLVVGAAAATASPAFGQESETLVPRCNEYLPYDDWGVWSGNRIVPTGGNATKLVVNGKSETFTAIVKSRTAGKTVTWAGEEQSTLLSGHPWIAFENAPNNVQMSLQFGVMQDRVLQDAFNAQIEITPGTAVFTADGNEVARYDGIKSNVFSVPINQTALLEIAARAQVLRLDFYVGVEAPENLFSSQEYALDGLPNAFAGLAGLQTNHLKTVADAGSCRSGCAMTTAAVEMLGRNDTCFELTQMRKLRAAFPDYDWVVRDYLESSAKLLARPGRRLTVSLMAFYGLVVWPTAVLVALGIRKPAGYFYLGGFALLKKSMGLR